MSEEGSLILDEVVADVKAQLDDQAKLGVQTILENDVPGIAPAHRGIWFQVPQVIAVFADMKGSTGLNASSGAEVAARAYTYFTRGMTVILNRFSVGYADIQGDGILGLFSGKGSIFKAAACAITMRTLVERDIADRFKKDASTNWNLAVGIGIDQGKVLVRQLGLRNLDTNEVWAGNPVNMAAKLSSLAEPNQIAVSGRVFNSYQRISKLRRRALMRWCGCKDRTRGRGLDAEVGTTSYLWKETPAPDDLGLDFDTVHRLKSAWCKIHGPEFCEAIVTGQRLKA